MSKHTVASSETPAVSAKTSTTKPGATKADPPAPELTGLQVAALTERELSKLTGHLVRLKEKRRKALAQLRAAEAALAEVHRQVRLVLRAATLDAHGRDQRGDADFEKVVGEMAAPDHGRV